jgi:hypothetical protein
VSLTTVIVLTAVLDCMILALLAAVLLIPFQIGALAVGPHRRPLGRLRSSPAHPPGAAAGSRSLLAAVAERALG